MFFFETNQEIYYANQILWFIIGTNVFEVHDFNHEHIFELHLKSMTLIKVKIKHDLLLENIHDFKTTNST